MKPLIWCLALYTRHAAHVPLNKHWRTWNPRPPPCTPIHRVAHHEHNAKGRAKHVVPFPQRSVGQKTSCNQAAR